LTMEFHRMETFVKITYFVFHRRQKVIEVWNDMKVKVKGRNVRAV